MDSLLVRHQKGTFKLLNLRNSLERLFKKKKFNDENESKIVDVGSIARTSVNMLM